MVGRTLPLGGLREIGEELEEDKSLRNSGSWGGDERLGAGGNANMKG